MIENIPVKSIEDSGNYNTISNFLITTALAHQPDLNNTESLWLANMKSLFESVSPPSNNLYVWASKIDSQTNINLLGFNIKNSVISTTVYQDYGKNNIGATEKRLLYKVAVLDTIEAYKDIISSDVKSSFEEGINYNNYGLTLYSDTNFRIYKGDIDDNGNLIDVLSLRNEKDIKKNLIFIQLGILEKEYNLLFYDSETIPDTSAPGYVPFLTNPARIYFHLDEETVPAGSGFQKFKLGLKYEDETGILITSFPTNDIFVYTIDGFFFFSNRYSEHQEFFENFPKCKINFRVESPYVGEFGFDWMRIEDTAAPGDVDYENNVGKLYNPGPPPTIVTNPNQDTGTFILHPELFKKLEFEYFPFPVQFDSSNLVEKYYVPVLTIYPPYVPIVPPGVDLDRQPIFIPPYNDDINRVAKLTLDIVVTEEPVSMKLEYDDTIFDITPIVIPKTVGTHTLNITVKCFKEFGTEQYIKALAYYNNSSGVLDSLGKTVGIIRVRPNTKQLRGAKKTIFIAIRTNINGVDNIPSLPDKAPFMMKYLRQILITPIFEVFELDMRTNGTFNSDYVRFDGGTNKVIIQDQTNPGLTYLGNFLYSEFTSMNIPSTTIPIGSIYDLDKRLFFIEESGGSINSAGNYVGLNGAAAGNNIIGFSTANNSTASHEFLHSANLPHSFTAYEASSYAKFTYRPLVTDNIMDYSHKVGINRVSLWDWQGKIANSSSDREP